MPKKKSKSRAVRGKEIVLYTGGSQVAKKRLGKKRRSKRINKTLRIGMGNIGPGTRQFVCSMVDPWGCSACIPDGAQGVGCFSCKEDYVIGTGTGTACSFFWNPNDPQLQSYTDTGGANANPIVSGNWAPAIQNTASIASLFAKTRPVSGGIRATFVGSTVADQGLILVAAVSGGVPPTSFNGKTLAASTALCMKYKIYPLRDGMKVTWRPQEMDDSSQFTTLATSAIALSNGASAPYLVCVVYGGNTGTASLLHIEAVANYEGQYESATFMPGGISDNNTPPAEAGWYEKAKDLYNQFPQIESFIPTVSGAIKDVASHLLRGPRLGSMANGLLAPGLLSQSGLPQLRLMN